MSFASSLVIGLVLGTINGVLWSWGARWWLKKRGVLVLFKLGILALVIWILLSKWGLDPVGFLVGFSVTLMGLLGKMAKWG